jgi:hypothetical protein
MTTTSREHDDDLEPTVTEDEVEVERYDVEDDSASEPDAKNSWDLERENPSPAQADTEPDEASDSL